jgi:hypothetical protein
MLPGPFTVEELLGGPVLGTDRSEDGPLPRNGEGCQLSDPVRDGIELRIRLYDHESLRGNVYHSTLCLVEVRNRMRFATGYWVSRLPTVGIGVNLPTVEVPTGGQDRVVLNLVRLPVHDHPTVSSSNAPPEQALGIHLRLFIDST